MRRLPLLVLVATLLAAGCGSDPDDVTSDTSASGATSTPDTESSAPDTGSTEPAGEVTLDGRTFTSVELRDGGQERPLAGDTPIRLVFADGTVQATGSCNSISGGYEVVDGVLEAGDLAMTMMACDPVSLMDQDDWVSALLGGRPTVTLDGDALTLQAGAAVLVLTEEEAAPDATLTGPTWQLESIGSGTGPDAAVSSVPAGVTATLVFGEDGRVGVQPGCNTGGGDYTVAGEVLEFGPLVLTRMACDEPAMEVEATVAAVLDGEVPFRIEGDRLTLTGADAVLELRAT